MRAVKATAAAIVLAGGRDGREHSLSTATRSSYDNNNDDNDNDNNVWI